jgi:hypothetical protein
MSEQKLLLHSHRELIRLKLAQAQAAQADLQTTLNTVAVELGIDIKNELWRLTPDGTAFEKAEEKKND